MFWKNTYNELIKIFAKPRSYIGFGAITIIICIILFAMMLDGKTYVAFITQMFDQSLYFEGKILNGNFMAYLILQMLIIHIPLLVALVTGDLISGEAAMGSIRILLTKPISRSKILFSKLIAGYIYTFILICWIAFLALAVSKFIFGTGDLLILKSSGLTIIQQNDVTWRYLLAFCMAYLGLILISTLSLTFSCFSENSIGPIVSTMAIIILFTIIGLLDIPSLDYIRPFLFTTYMSGWHNFFEDPLPISEIFKSIIVLLTHIVVLVLIAQYKFTRKDILS